MGSAGPRRGEGCGDSAWLSFPPRPEAPETSLQGWKCLGSLWRRWRREQVEQSSGRARTPRLRAGRGEGAPILRREGAGLGAPGKRRRGWPPGWEVVTPQRRDFVEIAH